MKINLCEPSFVLSRDFNAIDFDIVNNDIMKDENYTKALEEENPNTLCDYIIFVINKYLDKQSSLT